MSFTAQYDDVCADCGGPIARGQTVTYVGELVHVTCPPKSKLCPSCHIELPLSGECDTCG